MLRGLPESRGTLAALRTRRANLFTYWTESYRRPRRLAAACCVGVAVTAIAAAAPAPAADGAAAVLTARAEGSALVVHVESRCSEFRFRSPEAVLRWQVDAAAAPKSTLRAELEAASEFRVDLTRYPEGLERGDFESRIVPQGSVADPTAHLDVPKGAAPESAGREFLVGDLEPGVTYRARVLALTSQGWLASEQVMFRAAICPVDMDEDAAGGER